MTATAASGGGDGEELLLLSAMEAGGGAPAPAEESWRLNFDGIRPPEAHQERPPTHALHHCLGVLGPSLLPPSLFSICRLFWCLCLDDDKFRVLFYGRSIRMYVSPVFGRMILLVRCTGCFV
jgi:hypothetical protein